MAASTETPKKRPHAEPRRSGDKQSRVEAQALRRAATAIRDARIRIGITQEEAANRAGIDYKRWQRLEQGTVNPTVATLARIAAALRVKLVVQFE